MAIKGVEELRAVVDTAVTEVKITDVHTHLYAPCLVICCCGELMNCLLIITWWQRCSDG